MKKEKLDNISDLRRNVADVFMMLREGLIDVHEAATLAKLADTMISSSKVEFDYYRFTNSTSKIDFLEDNLNNNPRYIEATSEKKFIDKE